MNPQSAKAKALQYSKMHFLVSHGLQTPLSAIRWGCGRLRRTGDNLTDQQRQLLEGVQKEARLLSHMFDWMLLQAKVEEEMFAPNIQEVFVNDFLIATIAGEVLLHELELQSSCPDNLQIQVDRSLFAAMIKSILVTLAMSTGAAKLAFTVDEKAGHCVMTVDALLSLSLLQENDGELNSRRVVGGVPGCLLSIASSFAQALGGQLESTVEGETIQGLVLRLPLHPSLSSMISR